MANTVTQISSAEFSYMSRVLVALRLANASSAERGPHVSPVSITEFRMVQNSRIVYQNLAIDIAGLSWCIIPVQKYSAVYGRGIACDGRDQAAAARASRMTASIPSANLTSGMTSRKPAKPSRRRRRASGIAPKN